MFIDSKYLYNSFKELNLNVNLNSENVEHVKNIKYLGLVIDSELKLNDHVDYLAKKIGKKFDFEKSESVFMNWK